MRTDQPAGRAVAETRSMPRRIIRVGAGRMVRVRVAAFDARVDLAIIGAITLLAAVLRLWDLGAVPLGLHGDEAWTGIDARRVLHEGWIGPYLPSAVGQPIGPVYFTALIFKFLPQTTFTLRLSMAILGIATIPLAYAAFATMFDRKVAAFAALLLAVMMWHLHLSRTGFMVVSWPFVEMAVLLALWHAMRLRSMVLFVLAGALTGLGVYTYNAFYLFVPLPFVAMFWRYIPWRGRNWRWRTGLQVALFASAALAVTVPMLLYIGDHAAIYRSHQRLVSVTNSDRWKGADGPGEHAHILWRRAVEWTDGLVNGGRADFGDGLATDRHPPLGPLAAVLALAGVGVAIWNWRNAAYAVVLAALLTMPFGALLTTGDGLFRRTLGIAPFLALLAALPLAWLWEQLWRFRGRGRYAAVLALVVPVYLGVSTTYQYFGPVQRDVDFRFTYPYQMDAASHYISGLPDGTFVYFYSGGWSFDYETRRFVAPKAEGVDRSREFRNADRVITDAPLALSADASRPVAFVFLDPYLDDLAGVIADHPGGSVTEVAKGDETLFRAYYLPGGG